MSSGGQFFPCGEPDMKLIAPFRSFAIVPKRTAGNFSGGQKIYIESSTKLNIKEVICGHFL